MTTLGVGPAGSSDRVISIENGAFGTTGSIRVSAENYVGVGTLTPEDKLHVAGRGRFDDRVVAEAFYLEPGSGGGLWKDRTPESPTVTANPQVSTE